MASKFIRYIGPRIIPNTAELVLHWIVNTNHCENVVDFRYTSNPTQAQLRQLGHDFGNLFQTTLQQVLCSNVTFVECVVKDIGASGRPQATYTFPTGVTGGNNNTPVPLNVAAHLELLTAKQGRRFRGGKSISGFGNQEIDGNTLGSGVISALIDFGLSLLLSYVSGLFFPAVGSLPHVTAAGPPQAIGAPAESNIITSVSTVDTNTDSQKTRLNGRGR